MPVTVPSLCGKTNGRYKNDVAEAKREKQVFFIDSRIGERRMEEKSRYEEMYGKLVAYEQNIHLQNQKRIKIGLKCIAIIPPIFLILLFWTDSNKVVFLILWIVSLFALATYLILVEYVDYNLQEKLNELRDEEDKAVDVLMGKQLDEVEENIKNAIQKLDEKFNSEAWNHTKSHDNHNRNHVLENPFHIGDKDFKYIFHSVFSFVSLSVILCDSMPLCMV